MRCTTKAATLQRSPHPWHTILNADDATHWLRNFQSSRRLRRRLKPDCSQVAALSRESHLQGHAEPGKSNTQPTIRPLLTLLPGGNKRSPQPYRARHIRLKTRNDTPRIPPQVHLNPWHWRSLNQVESTENHVIHYSGDSWKTTVVVGETALSILHLLLPRKGLKPIDFLPYLHVLSLSASLPRFDKHITRIITMSVSERVAVQSTGMHSYGYTHAIRTATVTMSAYPRGSACPTTLSNRRLGSCLHHPTDSRHALLTHATRIESLYI